MRNIEFKIRLSESEHARLKKAADDCGLQLADYARYSIFGPSGTRRVPYQAQLKDALYALARISDNINRCMKAVHRAEKAGMLDKHQLKAMHDVIRGALAEWQEPREKWQATLRNFGNDR